MLSSRARLLPSPILSVAPQKEDDGRALVAAIRGGDKQAFEQLFRMYGASLCRYVSTIVRSQAVAEELVQDVFAHIWVQRGEWDVRGGVASYLYVAARNRAVNARKRGLVADRWVASITTLDRASVTSEPQWDAPDHRLERSELHTALARALERLPERCRETFILRRQHHLSYPEVAAIMGVTVKCVERQFTKALKILRQDLEAFL